jgi:hypothetical protein
VRYDITANKTRFELASLYRKKVRQLGKAERENKQWRALAKELAECCGDLQEKTDIYLGINDAHDRANAAMGLREKMESSG